MISNNYFLNASGCWCASETQLDELYHSKLGGIVTKTCTLYPKKGNPEPTFEKVDTQVYINSKGLPNEGYAYYKSLYHKYVAINTKPFILSVAWEHDEQNTIDVLNDYNDTVTQSEIVELNLSCPNLNHEIVAYNPEMLDKVLRTIEDLHLHQLRFSLKLSPYLDHALSNKIIDVINRYTHIVEYIVLSNSIPNALVVNSDCNPVLSNTYGGLSGKLNKYISLSNVHYFRKTLNTRIRIIGCGGICDIDDVYEYLNCGADYVQLGSGYYEPKSNKLNSKKIDIMIEQYQSL